PARTRGSEVVAGRARIRPGPAAAVGDPGPETPAVVIASGSRPKMLPELDITPRIITSDQALWYDHIPASASVIGAGAVGLEFASLYRSFGAQVTLIEALPRLAPVEGD